MNCQQSELYASERTALQGRSFDSVPEMQAFVDGLRDTWWWQLWYPQVKRVEVYGRTGASAAQGSVGGWYPDRACGVMEMASCHWCEQYLLHELAHVLAAARFESQAHCPWFARVYLELVAAVMGTEAYLALHAAFDRDAIQHDIPDDDNFTIFAKPMGGCNCHEV